MLGLGFGPLLCGILAQYLPYAMRLVFIVDFILIIPAFIEYGLCQSQLRINKNLKLKFKS